MLPEVPGPRRRRRSAAGRPLKGVGFCGMGLSIGLVHYPVYNKNLNLSKHEEKFYSPEQIISEGLNYLHKHGLIEMSEHVITTIPSRVVPERSCLIGMYYVKDLLNSC